MYDAKRPSWSRWPWPSRPQYFYEEDRDGALAGGPARPWHGADAGGDRPVPRHPPRDRPPARGGARQEGSRAEAPPALAVHRDPRPRLPAEGDDPPARLHRRRPPDRGRRGSAALH